MASQIDSTPSKQLAQMYEGTESPIVTPSAYKINQSPVSNAYTVNQSSPTTLTSSYALYQNPSYYSGGKFSFCVYNKLRHVNLKFLNLKKCLSY